MARTPKIAPNRDAAHPFDLKYGTDTAGYLSPAELRGGSANDAQNNGYSAVAPSVFREACRRWRASLPDSSARTEAYTFIDVGAGKGRALLLASEIPFRKLIGVELDIELARIAQQNLMRWNRVTQPKSKIRVVNQDAMKFRWPKPPLVVFLNNPFDCALVEQMAANLAALAKQGPSLIDLIYGNPGCADTLIKQRTFKLVWDAQISMDEQDQLADPYGAVADRVAAFRYAPQ